MRDKKRAIGLFVSLVLIALTLPAWAANAGNDEEVLRNANTVLLAMLQSKDIPESALAKADCIIVLPNVKKFAVGIGGTGGRGPMSCRQGKNFSGKWSAPAFYTIGGASAGLQLGGTSTDFVLLVMSNGAVQKVMDGKVKVGSDVTAAAGPGATAGGKVGGEDILTYARAKGLFAGVSLDGSTLDPDDKGNTRLYGDQHSPKDILTSTKVTPSAGGKAFMTTLDKTPKHAE